MGDVMKNLLAIGLVCCLPVGFASEDPNPPEAYLGAMPVLVVEESVTTGNDDAACARVASPDAECMSFNRAVLTGRIQEVSVLHERGRWM
jgi:hypothetical protein